MCPSLIEIGSKTAEKNSAQTNRQTDRQTNRHYENNGHLAVNQLSCRNWSKEEFLRSQAITRTRIDARKHFRRT